MLNRISPRSHGFGCPDEHQLAAYADQQLIGAERERVESHLAACDTCLQQVGFLIRQVQASAAEVPPWLLHKANELETAKQANSQAWRWAAVGAALVLVGLSTAVWRDMRPDYAKSRAATIATVRQPDEPSVGGPESEMSVRGGSNPVSLPTVLSPQEDSTVDTSDFVIRWQPVADAAAYEVRLVTADGDFVWQQRVPNTSVKPPQRALRQGSKYFLLVRALLPDGKALQSEVVRFVAR